MTVTGAIQYFHCILTLYTAEFLEEESLDSPAYVEWIPKKLPLKWHLKNLK